MNALIPGCESPARIELMVSLTRIRSEDMKGGLTDYFCKGMTAGNAAALNGLDVANLRKAIHQLNKIAAIVENIKSLDWAGFQQENINKCA